ncbi:MAG: Glycerophosphodiester phosphodiesterase [Acidimicrobiales bacterium]|nr:MAG: glycerophosphodiester phosphodiesterase [Actinomycetota bacterium]MBV6508838.1 Glycerophosphodiester phosphodiesterase [Acidimicrobiales bacterium]RIK04966.1 MAG: glycerophosphodiester phosphodiesterase [Acidobacteriota bacterium]
MLLGDRPSPPAVVAHRGASADHLENTIEAFRAALAQGADWVELDVRRTADAALAVHHDAALPDGRALVGLPAAELPPHVPQLGTALDACRGMGVNIEIKNLPGDPDFDPDDHLAVEVVAHLEARREDPGGIPQPVIVSSFNPETIARVRLLDPSIPTGWLVLEVPRPEQTVQRAVEAGHSALHPLAHVVDQTLVRTCHEAGLALNCWTVDEPARIRELVAIGVDGIVTNTPGVARRIVDELSAGS